MHKGKLYANGALVADCRTIKVDIDWETVCVEASTGCILNNPSAKLRYSNILHRVLINLDKRAENDTI